MYLYLLCILNEGFDCLCSLGDNDSNIADVSNDWSYGFILRDVEWTDLRVFRDNIWTEINKQQLRSMSISWSNGTISVHGALVLHFKIFTMILQLYFNNHKHNTYLTYDILVRYEELHDVEVQTRCDLSTEIASRAIKTLDSLVNVKNSRCLLL
jgi:hypothetical protein